MGRLSFQAMVFLLKKYNRASYCPVTQATLRYPIDTWEVASSSAGDLNGQFVEGQPLLGRFDVTSAFASARNHLREFAEEINDQ
jgi:hypothetical protein